MSMLAPYDQSKCDSDCPLCEKKFTNEKDSRKVLAKHMKDRHRFCDEQPPLHGLDDCF